MARDPRGAGDPGVPWWQPWTSLALFAFLLNFTWELLQVPFYRGIGDAPHWRATLFCLRASGGDVLIAGVAYGAVAAAAGRLWLARPTWGRVTAFLGAGLAVTAAIEWVSVYALGRWAYAEGVPVVLGVGLPPVLQWILLPPTFLWLSRRHLGWGAPAAPAGLSVREGP